MKYRELLKIEGLPVFQNKMFLSREAAIACAKGDVTLVQDIETGRIFNSTFDAALLKYDADYQNEQACSVAFQGHLKDVKAVMDRHFHGKSLIEVGCGKGYFLEYLQQEGYAITGVDPAYEGHNPKVIKACFDAGLGLSADGVILRHVLEHLTDPFAFLCAMARANGGSGQIYIEVPCFDWICRHRAWFDIYYEHVNYFRLADFYNMFDKVHETGHVFGGQYIYVVADLSTLRKSLLNRDDNVSFSEDFFSGVERSSLLARGKRNAIWGGASKGVIFAYHMQRAGIDIDFLIDINPAKQNKFVAGTGLKVLSPQEGMNRLQAHDNIFVMNSNYLQEVVALTQGQYNYIEVDRDEF